MTTKPPTPQGISALLKRAGFAKAVASRYSITYAGYHVRKALGFPAAVQVNYWGLRNGTVKQENEMLLRYVKAITSAGLLGEEKPGA